MKVIIIGATGQLGRDATQAFTGNGDHVVPLSHGDVEVSDIDSVSKVLRDLKPELIVNTAAMHNVEHCEQDSKRAFAVNALGPRNLGMVAEDLGATLMHISTDYVFDGAGRRPYGEDDAPRPLSVYGNTKLSGEYFARCTTGKHFVIRTSGLYGKHPCRAKGGLNFIELMLKLAKERGQVRVVDDEIVTPTSTAELASQLIMLSRSDCYGLYHATAEGSCSWYQFAREIFTMTGTDVKLTAAAPDEFPSKVARPKYSVLENRALKSHGLNVFRSWREGLHQYLGLGISPPSIEVAV